MVAGDEASRGEGKRGAAQDFFSTSMSARTPLTALLLGFLAAATACVTVGRTTIGSMPPEDAVRALKKGASVAEVLRSCGAPVEAWSQPEGLLLVYRRRHYNFGRYGFDASQALRVVDASNDVAAVVANLSLTIEEGTLGDDRLAVLFDRDGRLVTLAARTWDGGAP